MTKRSDLVVLRDALRPVHDKLNERIYGSRKDSTNAKASNFVGLVIDHLDQIAADMKRFADELQQLGWAWTDDGEAGIRRGVACLEGRLDKVLRNRDELYGLELDDEDDSEAYDLLKSIYSHILRQIYEGLDDWLDCLDDPEQATGKGQQFVRISDHEVRLMIEMSAPFELEDLLDWVKRRAITGHFPYDRAMAFLEDYSLLDHEPDGSEQEPLYSQGNRSGDGCLAIVAAFALGWMIGGSGE